MTGIHWHIWGVSFIWWTEGFTWYYLWWTAHCWATGIACVICILFWYM